MNSNEESLTMETQEPADLALQVKRIQEHLVFLERKLDTLLDLTRKAQERPGRPDRRPVRFNHQGGNQGHGPQGGGHSSFKPRRSGGHGHGHDQRRPEWKGRRDQRPDRGEQRDQPHAEPRPRRPFFKREF